MKIKKNLSLYIHIPFCVQKCKYCDFLSFPSSGEDRNSYIQELKKEIIWKSKWASDYQVISIFFGGGTPSLLNQDQMKELLICIKEHYKVEPEAEITLEVNPGTLTKDKLRNYKKCGINRLSMGLQSTDDAELRMLGRIHTFQEFKKNYQDARAVGFDNINIDLMSALPGQTMESYKKTLEQIVKLRPEHISAYSLIVEEGTPLAGDNDLLSRLPDEEMDRRMYQYTKEYLKMYGYERYEISNYAKLRKECLHNCVYWTGGEYLGFGLGASSYFEGERFHNETDISRYRFDGEKQEIDHLSKEDQMEEFMFLGLRMTAGIKEVEFEKKFHQNIHDVYGQVLKKQMEEGLIIREKGRIYLTERGLDVSNYVFCDYLL